MKATLKVGLTSMLVCLAATALANGQLKVTGEGAKQELDLAQFDAKQQAGYEMFKNRCTKCHAMERPIEALQTGLTPISKSAFDKKGIKKYVVKMMRKPNSGIAKKDAKQIVAFLQQARKIAEGK